MTGPCAAIEATNLRVVRGDKTILRGVSLRALQGEVVGVLGPSGAGKSTFFGALVGEVPVTDGEVRVFDKVVTRAELWERARIGVSYMPQTPSVLWDLSVRENLLVYHQIVHGRAASGADAAVEKLATRVALADRMSVCAGGLSGGERRRLELARALTRAPKVLVCDEPFAGVDPQQASRLADLLRLLADEEGVCVLLSDHHVAEALRICTRAVLLLDGQVAMEGRPEEFEKHPLVIGRYLPPSTYLPTPTAAHVPEIDRPG